MAATTVLAQASHARQMTSSPVEAADRVNQGQAALTVPSPPSAGMPTISEWFATLFTLAFLAMWLAISFA
jgi:hypothetical protein